MKKIFLTLTIALVVSLLILSCKKDKAPEPAYQTINHSLKVNQSYQFDLGNFGDEEGASITRQATNFSISSIDLDMTIRSVIYKYVTALDFVGTDEVVIRSARGHKRR
jgi:hypothetical protein